MLTPDELERIVVVLVAPRNPNNIGAAARAMSNFGFPHLRIATTYDVPFHDARSAVGAAETLAAARQFERLEEAVADCSLVVGTTAVGPREVQHPLHRLEAAGGLIRAHVSGVPPGVAEASAGRVAILFGSEKTGLSREDLSHCHWLLRIPTRVEHRSMNLGQAVSLCLYELIREELLREELIREELLKETGGAGSELPRQGSAPAATAEERERLLALLLRALEVSGYTQPNADQDMQQKFRRLILRLNPAHGDVAVLLGVLRQFLWKLNRSG